MKLWIPLLVILCPAFVHGNTETYNFRRNTSAVALDVSSPTTREVVRLQLDVLRSFTMELKTGSTSASVLDLLLVEEDFEGDNEGIMGWWRERERQWGIEMRTVRVCWPASSPSNFTFHSLSTVSSPPSLQLSITPGVTFPLLDSSSATGISYTLLYERIYLGGIPASSGPVITVLVGLLAFLWITGVGGRLASGLERVQDSQKPESKME